MDWAISHVPAISGGAQATLQAPDMRLLGQPVRIGSGPLLRRPRLVPVVTLFMLELRRTALGRALVAVREKDFAAAVIGVHASASSSSPSPPRRSSAASAGAVLIFTLLPRGHARAVLGRRSIEAAGDGHRRRPRQHHRQLFRRRPSSC